MTKKIGYIGNKLSTKGFNTTTIETLGKALEQEGYVVSYASSIQNPFVRLVDMLYSIVKNRKIDYVLIDTYSTSAFWYAFFCSQLCRLFALKYIPILHGGNLPERLKRNPKLSNLLLDNAYQLVAPSNFLKSEFENAGFKRIVFIPNSIELENYHFKERIQIQPKLLWVRAFASIYNPKMAIEVLRKLKQIYPEAELCMVGPDKDGSLQETKKYAEELSLKTTFTGKLDKKEWVNLSQEYDIFINTTHFDNTPVSVMEAMVLGLPVVSTNVGGIPFLIENEADGLLVEDNDVEGMVKKIEILIKNPDVANSISLNARKKAESFDWEVVKYEWFNLLK